MFVDFLGNEIKNGDKVIAVIGRHLRHCIIEEIVQKEGYVTLIKIKGLKNPLEAGTNSCNHIIKM